MASEQHPRRVFDDKAAELGTDIFDERVAVWLDEQDPLRAFHKEFCLPPAKEGSGREESVYLCGNSLGCMPAKARQYVNDELDQWSKLGVDGWFDGDKPWVAIDETVRDVSASIVGAQPSEVCIMHGLTVNLHLMMTAFYHPTPQKFKILVEGKAFPSDMHMLESQIRVNKLDPATTIVAVEPREGETFLRTDDVIAAIENEPELCLVLLSGIQYYTGQRFDMKTITAAAKAKGLTVGWDLAHAVGNVPLSLHDDDVDFACWCTYKYLNSGPGGIAGCFVHDKHGHATDLISGPRLAGWWGHRRSDRFDMHHNFIPEQGAQGFMLSTPPVLCYATLRASLELFDQAGGIQAVRAKSEVLTAYLEALLDLEVGEKHITCLTPRNVSERGAQLSLVFKHGVDPVFEALSNAGVVCDLRRPDVIRIAPAPLYNSFQDVWLFVKIVKEVLDNFSE